MIWNVNNMQKDEKQRNEPDTSLSINFQGNLIHPVKNSIFWYRWGDYVFDIRDLRLILGINIKQAIDLNLEMNKCTRFSKTINQVIKIIDNKPFLEIFKPR